MGKHMQMTMEISERIKNLEDQMARLIEQVEEWVNAEDTVSEYTLASDTDEEMDSPVD